MKKLVYSFIALLCTLTLYGQNSIQKQDFYLQDDRSFILNQGQFDGRNWKKDEIIYALDENPFYIFFTEKGLTYRFDKVIKNPKHEKGDPSTPKRTNISELVHATWVGANQDVEIVSEDAVDFYYSYAVRKWPTKDVRNLSAIPGYKKITYKNLYDNIDVEYVIHPEAGVKYSVIVHPGGDPSQVKLAYSSAHTNTKDEDITIGLNDKGQMEMNTSLGDIIEHEPYTYYESTKAEITSAYKFQNNELTFELDNYDPNATIVIDPWNITPNFTTSSAVWEVESDGVGNVYTIGGETPMELRKYNAAGALQWAYVTPWDTNSVWLGTLATDDVGNSYVTSGTSPEIEKINAAGVMQYHTNGTGLSTEYWSITFNCDKTKLIVGGTGATGLFGPFEARIYDMDINTGNVLAQQVVGQQAGFTPVEVRSISSSKNAKYIYLTHDQVGAINQNIGSCPTDAPYFEVDNGHHLAYKCENYLPETQNGGGLKALVSNDQFFYTHDGANIYQRNLTTGALINSAAIPGGNNQITLGDVVVHNSGLAVDDCGNVYAGSDDRVVKYDANLNFISESLTGFSVYDVSVNSNGEVLAVGAEFDNNSTNRVGHIASFAMSACAQYALVCCDATICPQDTVCQTDPAFNLFTTTGGGTFSGTGITNTTTGTFDPSVSGTGTFTITYTQTCGSDQIDLIVSPCVSLTACVETNGDITVTSGTGPFNWDEQVTTQDCSGCVIGCNFPPGCAVNTTTWQNFGTGTTQTPPSLPVQITDALGSNLIITDPTTLPPCATSCDPTISPAGPFCQTDAAVNLTAVDPGGTWSGTGITNGTTGTFDPSVAGPGTHTITYSLTCGSNDTEDIVVNATDDASFTYPSTTYCTTDADPTPTITGLTGGTFSIDNGGSINAGTGVIDLDASGAGSYTVSYLTNGPCPTTGTFNVTITTNANATITAAGPFCVTDAAVNLTAVDGGGTWGGTGITDVNLGTFDPGTAGAGTHNITYTIGGSCGDSDNINITVNAADDPSFSYAAGSFCLTDPNPLPTITGLTGGTFSIDNGGVINATTGEIDIAGSGAGSYTVTYLTNGPCPNSTTFAITITTGANATITAAGPFCETDAAVNLTAVDGGGVWAGTGITDVNLGTFDPATAGAGVHNISYTISGSCGDADNINITVNASDDPSFSYAAGSFCLTDPNPLPTITGLTGGTFSIDNGGVINAATGEIDITGSGAGSYTVTYLTNGPCPTSTTFGVTLTTGADATITAAGPFCESDPAVNLTAVDGGGTWAGTGITDVNLGTFDPATAGAGTYNISYTITGTCGDAENISITVNADDDPSFSYAAGSFCLTDPNPLPTITGLTGGTFSIDNGGVINATTGEIDITGSGAGAYTVTYLTNGPCPQSTTFAVTLTNGANATITAAGPFCETDAPVNLTAVDGGGVWAGTGITDVNLGTFDPSVAGPGSHNITYTISGSCGDSDAITVDVNANDDPSFSYGQASYCLTDPNPTPTVTGLTGGTFSIDNGGVINASTGEIDIPGSGAGSYTVTYLTNGPCPQSTTFAVTLTNGADATITAAGPFCETDAAVNLSAVDAGGVWAGPGITDVNLGTFDPATAGAGTHNISYTISGTCGDADNINIVVNASDDPSFSYAQGSYCVSDADPTPTITGLTGGTFSIDGSGVINASTGVIDLDASGQGNFIVTYQTNGACPTSATFNVTITNSLDATITAAGPFCTNDPAVNLTAVDGGGTWSGTGITDPNLGTFDPSVAGAGNHNITYTIPGACGSTDNITITVNQADAAAFSYTTTSFCTSDTDPFPSLTGTLGGTFTIDNGGVIDATTGNIDLDASGAGTFNVTYTTNGPCPDAATVTITISTAGSPTITPAGPYCETEPTVTLGVSTPGGTWSGTGITDPNLGTFDPATAGAGTHQIIYTLGGLCGGADTIDILVYGVPNLTVDGPFTINWGSSVQITASGGTSYSWSPDTDLSCNDCPDPIASPEMTTTYCVTAYNGTCSDTACTTVTVDFDCGEIYVPTAFTPHSGDLNSMECVMGGCIVSMHFRIYDRWGELVFESFDKNICWDGTHVRNGKPMSTGVYVYILDATLANGEEVNKKGNISLIR